MLNQAYRNHFDEEVLNASPLKFVDLLYRGTLDSIASARRYLRLGDIRARSFAISKAMGIITELSLSLNQHEGGELSRNLADLYGYVQMLLIKANSLQCDPPLEEAERLLAILAEAWESCAQAAAAPVSYQETYEPVSQAY